MYELLMQNMRGTEQVGRGDNQPAIDAMIVPSRAGRASLWARSRPCIVVGAEPAMRRPAGLLDLRRRYAAARRGVRGIRGVLRRASGAQFLIARRGRGSGRRSTAPTTVRLRIPRRAARLPSTASRRTSPRRPRAVLLRCSAFFHQVGINVRRRRARRYVAATPPRRAVPGHAQAGRAMLKPTVRRRGLGTGLDGHTHRRAPARSRAQHAGLSLLVTIGSEVLINSKTGSPSS